MYEKNPFAVIMVGVIAVSLLVSFYDADGITLGATIKGLGGGFFMGLILLVPIIFIITLVSGFFSKK